MNIVWKSGKEQLADIMTKVLPAADYNTLRTLLMNLRYLELDGWTPAKLLTCWGGVLGHVRAHSQRRPESSELR